MKRTETIEPAGAEEKEESLLIQKNNLCDERFMDYANICMLIMIKN
jgi:hypothetical protein